MDKKNIIEVDESNFLDEVIEKSESQLIVVDFWAPWCGPCKQLTPVLEKVINNANGKVILAKINLDENQQIAAQLKIQSIPTVLAFKNKQIVNAFQGVIPEKKIIEFIEKCLGEKLEEDFADFFKEIEKQIKEKNFKNAKEALIEFIANNPKDSYAISLYIQALIGLEDFGEADSFIDSMEEEFKQTSEIESVIQRLKIAKKNLEGPSLNDLEKKLDSKPNDIDLICEISDKYFATNEHKRAFELLLKHYPKHKERSKKKIVEFFNVLGNTNEFTIEYRKKLSQIMFS